MKATARFRAQAPFGLSHDWLGGAGKEAEEAGPETGPSPDEFASRTEYRQAKIAQRKEEVANEIHDTLQALEDLSLTPRGGEIGRAVVVEGPARQVSAALRLAGVVHASLDRPIELIKPRRRKGTEPKQRRWDPASRLSPRLMSASGVSPSTRTGPRSPDARGAGGIRLAEEDPDADLDGSPHASLVIIPRGVKGLCRKPR